jgi:hypothetical protein
MKRTARLFPPGTIRPTMRERTRLLGLEYRRAMRVLSWSRASFGGALVTIGFAAGIPLADRSDWLREYWLFPFALGIGVWLVASRRSPAPRATFLMGLGLSGIGNGILTLAVTHRPLGAIVAVLVPVCLGAMHSIEFLLDPNPFPNGPSVLPRFPVRGVNLRRVR